MSNSKPSLAATPPMAMQDAGGIMFWTLEHDALGDLSLVQTIDAVVQAEK